MQIYFTVVLKLEFYNLTILILNITSKRTLFYAQFNSYMAGKTIRQTAE